MYMKRRCTLISPIHDIRSAHHYRYIALGDIICREETSDVGHDWWKSGRHAPCAIVTSKIAGGGGASEYLCIPGWDTHNRWPWLARQWRTRI